VTQSSVTPKNERLAQLFLRYASPLSGLRRVPILGPFVSWAADKIVSHDSLTWVQIQQGPAAGLWLRLNPRTGRAAFEGAGEPEVQRALERHLRPGMNFYDIGANIGFFTLLGARLVGEKGRVTSFEADPEIAARLREHVARNHFPQATVEEKAVWSQQTVVKFSRSDPNVSPDRGLGHIASTASTRIESTNMASTPVANTDVASTKVARTNDASTNETGCIEVQAVSLDEYTSAFPPPDFLKCDVEGAEVQVFRGAQRLLAQKRPGILCEMHSEENHRILLEEFARLRYQCSPCGENHVLALPE
jgi:FkbM family methyltransferase